MNTFFKKSIPYLVALVFFYLMTLIFYYPILEGKRLSQHDIDVYTGSSKEIADYRLKHDDEPIWTNSMFSGMPGYMISVLYKNNVSNFFAKIFLLGIPYPYGFLFVCFAGFFLLLLVLKVNVWISMIGSMAYALSTYLAIIMQAGHNTKMMAIAFMAPLLAGVILAFRKKYLLGSALVALFLALEINSNHLQITYYLLLIVLIYGLSEFINAIREHELLHFFKAVGMLLIAVALAMGVNSTNLMVTNEYLSYSTRGESELSLKKDDKTKGLDRSYATAWSYGIGETFTLLIPNTKGGATGAIGKNEAAMEKVSPEWKQNIAQNNHYWGDQPSTSGPVYVGAIVMFLFLLGLFIIKSSFKWAMLAATIVSIVFAWGSNFMGFTNLMLDYLPLYNKFRAVSMTLVIAELCIPVIAAMALYEVYKNPGVLKEKAKYFYISFGLTGGLALLFALMPSVFFNFISAGESEQLNQQMSSQPQSAEQIQMFISQLETARISIFRADAWRSFGFILVSAALLFFYSRKKIPAYALLVVIGLCILIDLWPINRRYLNESHFVSRVKTEKPFAPSPADTEILQDKDPNFRVFNNTVSTFNDASTSYFHKSIGGYHGAKMGRYQELIEFQISKNNMKVLNMLNTKYFIMTDPSTNTPAARRNPEALGNAWFVPDYKIVLNADSELLALTDFDPRRELIVDKRFEELLSEYTPLSDSLMALDSTAFIRLTEYQPNKLVYDYRASAPKLTVFSEIYYSKGWKAYIDDKEVPYFRANYVLRAMVLPAGNHKIEFRFVPETYYLGERISFAASSLMVLLLLGAFGWEFYFRRRKNKPAKA